MVKGVIVSARIDFDLYLDLKRADLNISDLIREFLNSYRDSVDKGFLNNVDYINMEIKVKNLEEQKKKINEQLTDLKIQVSVDQERVIKEEMDRAMKLAQIHKAMRDAGVR